MDECPRLSLNGLRLVGWLVVFFGGGSGITSHLKSTWLEEKKMKSILVQTFWNI